MEKGSSRIVGNIIYSDKGKPPVNPVDRVVKNMVELKE